MDRLVNFCIFPLELTLKIAARIVTWSSAIKKITYLSNASYTKVI